MMKNKSTLAKLLSEEDINVVYKQMETAYFNSKTRELGLPIWKDEDMSAYEHDLMLGHEVGHALWTPLEMLENAKLRNIDHSFVNIVEDARIEKFAKRKYPGLVNVFKRGYAGLVKKDFFGTKERGIGTFGFIDRINVFYKTSDISIPFSDDERPLMEKVATVETEEDVLSLAEEIFKFMEGNPESNSENTAATDMTDGSGMGMPSEESGDNGNMSDSKSEDEGSTPSSPANGSGDEEKSKEDLVNEIKDAMKNGDLDAGAEALKKLDEMSKKDGTSDSDDNGDDGDDTDADAKSNSTEGGIGPSKGSGVPVAETDDIAKKILDGLRDTGANDRDYGNIPKIDSAKYIIGYKEVLKETSEHYNKCRNTDNQNGLYFNKCLEEVETIKKENKNTVAYMVKEFEMKKSADAYARAATAKTGSLDMGKLHTYKFNEDLFKKVTVLPGATNHGLIMIVDWSGSMNDNLKSTVIQTMNLVWFCRRVKIPFRVFAFSDAYEYSRIRDMGWEARSEYLNDKGIQKFKAGDLVLHDFRLLEFFSSNMSVAEETTMMSNLFMMINRYQGYRDWDELGYPYDQAPLIHMGGTPLNDAIIVAMDLVEKFKKDADVQKIHTIFLTDGASNRIAGKYDSVFDTRTGEHNDTTVGFDSGYSSRGIDRIITDPVNNKKYKIEKDTTNTLLRVLKGRVDGMNVIGFFVAGTGRSGRIDKQTIAWITGIGSYSEEMKVILKKVNKDKFYAVEGNVTGYDEYYLLPGGSNLDVENAGLDDDLVGASKAKLKSAFGKSMKGKVTSRVLLNRFIKLVA